MGGYLAGMKLKGSGERGPCAWWVGRRPGAAEVGSGGDVATAAEDWSAVCTWRLERIRDKIRGVARRSGCGEHQEVSPRLRVRRTQTLDAGARENWRSSDQPSSARRLAAATTNDAGTAFHLLEDCRCKHPKCSLQGAPCRDERSGCAACAGSVLSRGSRVQSPSPREVTTRLDTTRPMLSPACSHVRRPRFP